ncbi:hypothetical protein OAN22_01135 [Alphaproteobacteria bacterium]|nr:hypothetical protein [Alphaproteobacteria bacterium]
MHAAILTILFLSLSAISWGATRAIEEDTHTPSFPISSLDPTLSEGDQAAFQKICESLPKKLKEAQKTQQILAFRAALDNEKNDHCAAVKKAMSAASLHQKNSDILAAWEKLKPNVRQALLDDYYKGELGTKKKAEKREDNAWSLTTDSSSWYWLACYAQHFKERKQDQELTGIEIWEQDDSLSRALLPGLLQLIGSNLTLFRMDHPLLPTEMDASDGFWTDSLHHCSALQHLTLTHCAIGWTAASKLAKTLEQLPNLRTLILDGNSFSETAPSQAAGDSEDDKEEGIPASQLMHIRKELTDIDDAFSLIAKELCYLKALSHLSVRNASLSGRSLKFLAAALEDIVDSPRPHLKLDLSGNAIEGAALATLFQMTPNSHMKELLFHQTMFDPNAMAALLLRTKGNGHAPALKGLSLDAPEDTHEDLKVLLAFHKLTALEGLFLYRMNGWNLGPTPLKNKTQLTSLVLSGTGKSLEGLGTALMDVPHLHKLIIQHIPMEPYERPIEYSDESAPSTVAVDTNGTRPPHVFDALRKMYDLEILRIDDAGVRGDLLIPLMKALTEFRSSLDGSLHKTRPLHTLSMEDNGITGDDLKAAFVMKAQEGIEGYMRRNGLTGPKLDDTSSNVFSYTAPDIRLSALQHLESLSLSGNPLGKEGVSALCVASQRLQVHSLDLSHCGIGELRELELLLGIKPYEMASFPDGISPSTVSWSLHSLNLFGNFSGQNRLHIIQEISQQAAMMSPIKYINLGAPDRDTGDWWLNRCCGFPPLTLMFTLQNVKPLP